MHLEIQFMNIRFENFIYSKLRDYENLSTENLKSYNYLGNTQQINDYYGR